MLSGEKRLIGKTCQYRNSSKQTAIGWAIAAGAVTLGMLAMPAAGAPVIGVADGDTLTVLVDGEPVRIRLANVDAPEKKQAFGERSKLSLSELCYRRDATYSIVGIDRYGRTIATVLCDGVDVNRVQVERGMAWVYTQYNKDRSLVTVEVQAKAAKRGLWADRDPVPPWEFRHGK